MDDLLRVRNLQHTAPMLDSLGVEVPSDLRFIYVEDLMEEGISYAEAIKLQGYPSSGAIRPSYPSTSELRTLPVKIHGRFGAIRSRPWRGRRAQPAQSNALKLRVLVLHPAGTNPFRPQH